MKSALVINIPYAGGALPPAVAKRLALSDEALRLEHWRLTDPVLAQLVSEAAGRGVRGRGVERAVIINPWSPLTADPWGLWAAELEPETVKRGRAAVLARTTAGQAIEWSPAQRETIFSRAVEPFYQQISQALEAVLEDSPLALLLTLRFFSSRPQAFERQRSYPRPQVCVGSCPGLTPEGLASLAGSAFRGFGWWPELNKPQEAGACLPPLLASSTRVRALGLSFNRELYLDERSGRRQPGAKALVRVLSTVFNLLDQELARVAALRLERHFKPAKNSPVIKADRFKKGVGA